MHHYNKENDIGKWRCIVRTTVDFELEVAICAGRQESSSPPVINDFSSRRERDGVSAIAVR